MLIPAFLRSVPGLGALAGPLRIGLPVWLAVSSLWLHLRPELTALTALAAAVLLQLAKRDEAEGEPGRVASAAAVIFAVSAVAVGMELAAHEDRIPLLMPLSPPLALAAGVIVAASLWLAVRLLGVAVAAVVLVLIAYALLGHLVEGPAGHGLIRPAHFLDLTIFTTDGLLGAPLGVVTGTIVHFLLFAALLERSGASATFSGLAHSLCGRSRGGAAKVAVLSSGFFGTISGSPTSDVVATGSITIPAMLRAGYPREKAAAVEVAASTGGSILPPVMGTAAFVLAEYTGTPYGEVIEASLLPALLYYGYVLLSVDLDARRCGYGSAGERLPQLGLRQHAQLLIPAAALLAAFALDYPPAYAATAGMSMGLLVSVLRPGGPFRVSEILAALEAVGARLAPVIGACAAAGLVIGSVTMTGLSGKAAGLVLSVTDGALIPTLALVGLLALIFGLGMPTTAAYILGAMLLAPALVDSGVPLLHAHLFVLYYSVLSAMTPPIAVAAFAAAAIAGGSPYAIGIRAMGFAAAAFVLPFAFVLFPGLLLEGGIARISLSVLQTTVALAAMALAVGGVARHRLSWPERLAAAAGATLLLTPAPIFSLLGLALALLATFRQVTRTAAVHEGVGRNRG